MKQNNKQITIALNPKGTSVHNYDGERGYELIPRVSFVLEKVGSRNNRGIIRIYNRSATLLSSARLTTDYVDLKSPLILTKDQIYYITLDSHKEYYSDLSPTFERNVDNLVTVCGMHQGSVDGNYLNIDLVVKPTSEQFSNKFEKGKNK